MSGVPVASDSAKTVVDTEFPKHIDAINKDNTFFFIISPQNKNL
jgi:hypothetical protein